MERIPKSPILESNPNQLEEVRKFYGFKDAKALDDVIDTIQDWIKKQNHFVVRDIERSYIEACLIVSCKGSIEKAKTRLDKIFTVRTHMPEYLQNFEIKSEFNNILKTIHHIALPKPTMDHYRIMITQLYGDLENLNFVDFGRFAFYLAEYLANYDYVIGYELVIDARIAGPSILPKLNPVVIGKVLLIMIQGFGVKLRAIHLINGSKIVDVMVSLLKQGLSEKIGNRINVHASTESLLKVLPKDLLPSDYGGDQKSVKELADATLRELNTEDHIQRVKRREKYQVDESKRISTTLNDEYLGLSGSFRTLCVD